MSDFVERLRKQIKFSMPHNTVHIDLLGEAADRIEALESALAQRKELLGMLDYLENSARIKDITGFVAPEVKMHNTDVENFAAEIRAALAPEQDK
jgi:hypothetical protein